MQAACDKGRGEGAEHLGIDGKSKLRDKDRLVGASVVPHLQPLDAVDATRHIPVSVVGSSGVSGAGWRLRREREKTFGQQRKLMLDAIFARFEVSQGCLARVALHQQLVSQHLHLMQGCLLLSRVFVLFRAQFRLQMKSFNSAATARASNMHLQLLELYAEFCSSSRRRLRRLRAGRFRAGRLRSLPSFGLGRGGGER